MNTNPTLETPKKLNFEHHHFSRSEIITTCMYCQQVRLENGDWASINLSQTQVLAMSHSICPDCYSLAIGSILKELSELVPKKAQALR